MKNTRQNYLSKIITTLVLSLLIGIFLIYLINESPMDVFTALVNGAFGTELRLGTTLAMLTPLLLTATAFAVAAKSGVFNIGVEGTVFLGALAATYVGVNWTFLPKPLLIIVMILVATIVGAMWSFIPAFLKVNYDVNEITVSILLNTVAVYITSYFVNGPMSSGTAVPQSHPVNARLTKFLAPSNANSGLFIAIIVMIVIYLVFKKTSFGYRVNAAGTNFLNAEYAGINPKLSVIQAMMLSGAIGGLAGAIEILGVYGLFTNNFAKNLGVNGMLISLISGNSFLIIPFIAILVASLSSGGLGIQIATNVPKSMIDTLIAVIIVIATMNGLSESIKESFVSLKNRFFKKEEA